MRLLLLPGKSTVERTCWAKLVVSGGMGGMGGAQPLAATMNGAAFLGIDVNPERIERRVRSRLLRPPNQLLCLKPSAWLTQARKDMRPLSVGLVGNCADILPELVRQRIVPDLLTDQTSAHDPLNGYIPAGLSLEEAKRLRASNPEEYLKRSMHSIGIHVQAMLDLQKMGAVTFDYGNNIRHFALEAGIKNAFDFPGFIPAYIRPLFCEGRGPFRWVALSGDPRDIAATDDVVLKLFP